MFETAAATVYHKERIEELLTKLKEGNKLLDLKQKSVLLDIQDPHVMAILHALAIMGVKVTLPYWDLVTSRQIQYLDLHQYIQPLLKRIGELLNDTMSMISPDDKPIFVEHPPNKTSSFY